MRVSIIIPAFNEEKLIGRALSHVQSGLTAFSRRGWDSEIVVCDNNSSDRTAEIARVAGAQVVFEPINSISRARNRGAEAASGNWFLFIDADSFPGAELLEDVAQAIESGECLAGTCTGKFDERHLVADLIVGSWNCLSRARRLMAGWFIFCDAGTFRQVGGFNSTLYFSEDIDLSIRLRKPARESGRQIVVLHRHPLVTSGRKIRLYGLRKYLWFWLKTGLSFGRTMKNRDACAFWYDGRR